MIELADVTPEISLAALLDNNIVVQTSTTKSHTIRVYADEERPNKGIGDEFIDVEWNGNAHSLTNTLGLMQGNLLLTIWCKAQTDGRAKKKIVRQIISQCQSLIDNVTFNGFHFSFATDNVITPTTTNLTTGYSTTILNIKWHTTDDFYNKY